MMFPAIAFPYVNPTILSIGELHIRWYGLMYVLAFVVGSWIAVRLLRHKKVEHLTKDVLENLLFWVLVGVILGGRLGYILFYNLPYYLAHPFEVFAVWQGGMSFHGGLLGVIVAGLLFTRKHKLSALAVADLLVVPAALGLAFGRVGNFLNAELIGREAPAWLPWAMYFPNQLVPRHPSQLYAIVKDLLLFSSLLAFYPRLHKPGAVFGVFLTGYGALRFLVEFTREPDPQIGFLGPFTLGQFLCIPMIIAGIILLVRKRASTQKSHA